MSLQDGDGDTSGLLGEKKPRPFSFEVSSAPDSVRSFYLHRISSGHEACWEAANIKSNSTGFPPLALPLPCLSWQVLTS